MLDKYSEKATKLAANGVRSTKDGDIYLDKRTFIESAGFKKNVIDKMRSSKRLKIEINKK